MSSLKLRIIISFVITLAGSQIFAQGVGRNTKDDKFDDGTLEKARNEYWYNIKTSGDEKDLTKINKRAYNAMHSMENRLAFKSLSSPAWVPIAGSQDGHNSGRVRDVAVDPTNPNVVFIAAASGGVWKTLDITAKPIHWVNSSDGLTDLLTTAIAINPQDPKIMFVGTGEVEDDGYKQEPGEGVFRSTDGGNNWTNVAPPSIAGNYCQQIVIDSTNPQIVYVATATGSGIIKSTDGGNTWKKLTLGISPYSMVYNSRQPQNIMASSSGSIYRSIDAGVTWTKAMTGIPTSSVARITLAASPEIPNLVYASIGNGGTQGFLGIWKSEDFGATWVKMTTTTANPLGTQQFWCNSIAVRPSAPNQLAVGGLNVMVSTDSGKTLPFTTQWNPPLGSYPPDYVHADIHRLVAIGNVMYACTDGGLARSTSQSGYHSWQTDINTGLATLQFVGVDADKAFTFVTGGCQDNGTNRAYIQSPEFTQTKGGDGGRGWVSPNDGGIVYTTYVNSTFYQSLDSGKTFNGTNLIEQNTGLFRDPITGKGTGEGAPFYPAYDVSPDGILIAFGGNLHVWVSIGGGSDGFPLKSDKQIGGSSAIHIFQGEDESSYIWAGSGSTLWRSTDQGTTWLNKVLTNPSGTIMGITSNPNNKNEVFVVTQGYGLKKNHFHKSEDGGATFTTPSTNFPDIGAWCIAISPRDGNLYVGTDKGVLYSADGGITWNPLMNGMPFVEVLSLKIKGKGNDTLLAGTYGRGVFWTDLSILAGATSVGNTSLPLSLDPSYPNPITSSNASMNFTLQNSGIATLTLFDVLGRELRILEKSYFDAGKHSVSFTTSDLPKGAYFVMLTANGRAVSQKIIVE